MGQTFRFEGHITLDQARAHRYLYLPFSVPAGASLINVSYAYSEPATAPFGNGPGNVVDVGIFDSRGHEFPQAAGFRGWSGASRPEFFLACDDATPGYIRGPLFPGEWNIILGVDRTEPEGVRYEVAVTVEEEQAGSNTPLPAHPNAPLPAHPEVSKDRAENDASPSSQHPPRWLKGDLHCHTVHSDGLNSVEEIVRNAIGLGLDFLAVTDHNTNTHHEELDRLAAHPEAEPALRHRREGPIVLIPGEEVTTYWGHANMWGLREWIDFRCADEDSIHAVRDYVLQKGGLISVNHPKSVGPPWLFKGWDGYPAMEVWQAPWRFYNWESLERWDTLLQKGERVVAVGGSDVHSIPPAEPRHPHGLANPTTWVYAPSARPGTAVGAGFKPARLRPGQASASHPARPEALSSVRPEPPHSEAPGRVEGLRPRAGIAPTPLPAHPEVSKDRAERQAHEQAVLDGIRAGHVFITDAPNETHLVLTADTDGDGRFETLMGDTIEPRDGRPVRFRIRARGNPDWRLWLIAGGAPIDIRPLDKVDSTHEFELDISGRRYLRAELRGHRGRPERGEVVWAMTNPIWVK